MNPNATTLEHHDPTTGRRWTTKHRGPTTATTRTPATEDWTLVDQINADPHPLEQDKRRAILMAVIACAIDNDGEVHASTLRPLLPEGVNEHLIGNVMSQLARAGVLVKTGRYLPSGDSANRNAHRDLPVRRVTSWERLRGVANRG